MSDFVMTIDGEAVATPTSLPVVNPATGEEFARAPECSADLLDAAMASAARAVGPWQRDEAERRRALKSCAAALLESQDELARVLTAEQGKPTRDAVAEVKGAAAWFGYFAGLQIPAEVLQDDEKARVELRRKPLGVVAAITPWNYPLLLAAWKIAPGLLAGNSVVLKPSPYTPLTSLMLGQLLAKVLPAGVLNVVSGGDLLGPLVTEHPVPRKISFTGSTATGRLVAASAAKTLKHVTLELGGNDAAIVLDDVDPAAIADRLFWASFANNGQTCVAIKRLYVPETAYAKVVDLLAERARSVVVGDGADPTSQLGPVNNQPQRDQVAAMVDAAVAGGAELVAGGSVMDRPGYFYPPTVVADISDDADLVALEQFGPALPILSYRTVDEAIERANATDFGLAGSVWGADEVRAAEVAAELCCGTAWVNTHVALAPQYPFSGFKSSGLGVENGLLGYYSFTGIQTHHVAKA